MQEIGTAYGVILDLTRELMYTEVFHIFHNRLQFKISVRSAGCVKSSVAFIIIYL
jgi:hypothetical protein